ncbi:MAG: hypothetical protein ACR2HS_05330, partial [Gammaproteobacteria bacterium]
DNTIMAFQLTSTNGVLTLPNTAGLTGVYSNATTGYNSFNTNATGWFYGTRSNINQALSSLIFTPTSNWTGTGSISITSYDYHGAGTTTNSVSVVVSGVNQAPINNVPAAVGVAKNTNFTFNGTNQISISDIDDAGSIMQVSISSANGTVSLGATTGLTFITGSGSNSSNIVFTGTKTNINNDLNNLVFKPNTGFTGVANIAITTSDLGNTGAGGAKTDTDYINISVNDPTLNRAAPITIIPVNQTINSNATLVFSPDNNNAVIISDPNAGSNPVINVTITATNGVFNLINTSNIQIAGGNTACNLSTVTITGTLDNINNALNGLQFISNSNFSGTANLQITSYDQGNT